MPKTSDTPKVTKAQLAAALKTAAASIKALLPAYEKAVANRATAERAVMFEAGRIGAVLATVQPLYTGKGSTDAFLAWASKTTGFKTAMIYRAMQVATVVASDQGAAITAVVPSVDGVSAFATLAEDQRVALLANVQESGDTSAASVTKQKRALREANGEGDSDAERKRKRIEKVTKTIRSDVTGRVKRSKIDPKTAASLIAYGVALGVTHGESAADAVQSIGKALAKAQ